MSKSRKIKVQNTEITILSQEENDYISLTDMLKAKEGQFFIDSWLRNRNTVEFLSIWESINNPNFNCVEFDVIKSKAGLNSFKLSVKEWVGKTNAIGIMAKSGRYGGTYAHKDIAFEFGMWISAEFKLYLIKEFQLLKEKEARHLNEQWDYRRFLTKVNYRIQTDAIKNSLIPSLKINNKQEWIIYAEEADILNYALFEKTSKQWKDENPERVLQGRNIRDYADILQLTVLANLESYNSIMIKEGISKPERLVKLRKEAVSQLSGLKQTTYNLGSVESPFTIQESDGKLPDPSESK